MNETAILEFILNYQEVPCVTSYSSINTCFVYMGYYSGIVDKEIEECGSNTEDMVEDVDDTTTCDNQFYEMICC